MHLKMSNIYSSQTPWVQVKKDMLVGLYEGQIRFWNRELAKLIQLSAQTQGIIISEAQAIRSALQYKGKTFKALPETWLSEIPETPDYHIPFSVPDKEDKLQQVLRELSKIEHERYESDRFMATLPLYGISNVTLADLVGDNLYKLVAKAARPLNLADETILPPMPWEQFKYRNADVLEHMQERVMVNFLMSDYVR